MTDITDWLASIGLNEYSQRFINNGVDLSVVPVLTEQDLKDLGVLLDRRIAALNRQRHIAVKRLAEIHGQSAL